MIFSQLPPAFRWPGVQLCHLLKGRESFTNSQESHHTGCCVTWTCQSLSSVHIPLRKMVMKGGFNRLKRKILCHFECSVSCFCSSILTWGEHFIHHLPAGYRFFWDILEQPKCQLSSQLPPGLWIYPEDQPRSLYLWEEGIFSPMPPLGALWIHLHPLCLLQITTARQTACWPALQSWTFRVLADLRGAAALTVSGIDCFLFVPFALQILVVRPSGSCHMGLTQSGWPESWRCLMGCDVTTAI